MASTTANVRWKRDFRFWLPASIAAVITALLVMWAVYQYNALSAEHQRAGVAHWQTVLARLQYPMGVRLAAIANNGDGASEDRSIVDRLMKSFPAEQGLTLALIDRRGRVLFANQPGLQNRDAQAVLPQFNPEVAWGLRVHQQGALVRVDEQQQLLGYAGLTLGSGGSEAPSPVGPSTVGVDGVIFVNQSLDRGAPLLFKKLAPTLGILLLFGWVTVLAVVAGLRYFVSRPLQIIQREIAPGDATDHSQGLLATHAGSVTQLAQELDRTTTALQDREQRLDRILHAIADGVITIDREGLIEWLNPAAEELTGWAVDEARGQSLTLVYPVINGSTGMPPAEWLTEALGSGRIVEERNGLILTDRRGGKRDVSALMAPIFGREGGCEGAVLTFRDLSQYNRTREESRVNAVAFEASAPQLIADCDGKIIRANQSALEVSGFSRGEVLGKTLQGFIFDMTSHPELIQFFRTQTALPPWRGRSSRKSRTGKLLHFLDLITPICDEKGALTNYVVSFQDVTSLVNTSEALQQTEHTYQTLVESIHDGVLILTKGVIVDCNQAMCDMLAREKQYILGRTMAELSPRQQPDGKPSDRPLQDIIASAGGGSLSATFEWNLLCQDGAIAVVEASVKRLTWGGQKVFLATVRDISDRNQHEQERQRLLNRLERKDHMTAQAAKIGGIATFEVDLTTGMIVDYVGVNEMLNLDESHCVLSIDGYLQRLYPDDRDRLAAIIADGIEQRSSLLSEHRIVWPDGALRWIRSNADVEYDANGTPLFMRGAFIDITDIKQAQAEVERLAYYDALTGLANRRLLLDRLRQACSQTQRNGEHGGVLFIDLDRFKLLNDSLGHRAGDGLLKKVAARLRGILRDEDTVARLGGDEFVVVLPTLGTSAVEAARQAHRVAEKIREMLAVVYVVDGPSYYLSGSIGIALFPSDGENAEVILHHADAAMYLAKRNGRNTIAYYEHSLQEDADRRLALEQDLRRAVELEQLQIYYQPRIDGGKVVGAEALLRWDHATRGAVSPLEFISIAEEAGLIFPLGKWVMMTACNQLAQWNSEKDGVSVNIAVNVSPLQFRHPDFVGCVTDNLRRTEVDPRLLTLEITEGTLIENIDETIGKLNQLQALGVNISIDDFGTGYSSLYYLKNLPLDEIKIDQSYIRDILTDASDLAIVDSIIAIANNLGLVVVAEGVETIEQARLLREMGCDCHQGFLYSKAVEATVFTQQFLSADTTNVLPFDRASA